MGIPPPSELGTDYVVTNYHFYLHPSFTGPMGFGITAFTDNTKIRITINSPTAVFVTYNSVNYTNGETITDTMNKYETIQVIASSAINRFFKKTKFSLQKINDNNGSICF